MVHHIKRFAKVNENSMDIPFLPCAVFSVSSNHFCEISINAEIVERPLRNACWLSFNVRSAQFSCN